MTRTLERLITTVLVLSPLYSNASAVVITAAKPLTIESRAPETHAGTQNTAGLAFEHATGPSAQTGLTGQNLDVQHANAATDGNNPEESDIEIVKTLRTHYVNGQMESLREVRPGTSGAMKNHGMYKLWDQQGGLVANGSYCDGVPDGKWKRIYRGQDGTDLLNENQEDFDLPLISTFQFSDGNLAGEWKIADASGRLVRKWNFRQGKLEGEMAVYFSSGSRMLSAMYEQGVPTGMHREWTNEGELVEALLFQNGRLVADVVHRWPNGNLQAKGRRLQPRYRLTVKADWWNGKIAFESSEPIGQPQKIGEWTYYTRQGKPLQNGTYVRGEREGLFSWWYADGQLQARGDFIAGAPHGEWTWWYENGKTKTTGQYYYGKETGDWVHWDNAGVRQGVFEYTPLPKSSSSKTPGERPSTQRIRRRSIDIPLTADRDAHQNLQLQKATRIR